MVKEVAGLLSAAHVNCHFYAVFGDYNALRHFAKQSARGFLQSFFLAHGGVAALVYALWNKNVDETLDDKVFLFVYAERKKLANEIIRVFVHDESRQAVRFGKHRAIRIVKSEILAHIHRLFYASGVKTFVVCRLGVANEDAHENFGQVVDIPFAHKTTVVSEYACKRAVFVLAFYARDFVGIHPTVTLQNTFFFAFFEINREWHINRLYRASVRVSL